MLLRTIVHSSVLHRGHKVSNLRDVQKPTVHSAEQSSVADPAFNSGVGLEDFRDPCQSLQFCGSVIPLIAKRQVLYYFKFFKIIFSTGIISAETFSFFYFFSHIQSKLCFLLYILQMIILIYKPEVDYVLPSFTGPTDRFSVSSKV